ncbi:MAG: hypothetical protein ACC707_07920 [Thiohalomonadales bacterium]
MREIDSARMTWILSITAFIAIAIFLYVVSAIFRLDWVRYDSVEREWRLESLLCDKQKPHTVIRFYRTSLNDPDFPMHFNANWYEYLSQQQQTVTIKRKLVGYLPEWDYGIIVPLTIAGKKVNHRSIIPPEQTLDCKFDSDAGMIRKTTSSPRRMR